MKLTEKIALAAMFRMDPERGHSLAIKALKLGLTPTQDTVSTPRLHTMLAGLSLPNPIGLAAGFDKNAEVIGPLLRSGFGFIEVGAATPLPQPGNPKPRLFRLREDEASINRFGFNNQGMDAIAARLAARPLDGIVGINLGANKTSDNRAQDFATVLRTCGPHVDFATVNVSSPNTEKLRDLQGEKALHALLTGVMDMRENLAKPVPIFLKIAPDLTTDEIAQIANVAKATKVDAIIATNTTLDRTGLVSPHKDEVGGLAGAPLFEKSTRVLAELSVATDGAIPLIGVGGVSTAAQALAKIKAGASAVQLYTGLVYGGLSMVNTMATELDALLAAEGFTTIADAVGTDRAAYL